MVFLEFETIFEKHSSATLPKMGEEMQEKGEKANFWLSANRS